MPDCTRTLRRRADRDPLTGFYNHRYLHERLGEEVVRAQRGKRPLSVLMLDLDDFKLVNDTFGHLFGDRVLTWAAELIKATLRVSDVPARYGGDEFAVILPDTDPAEATRAAERILERLPRAPVHRRSSGDRSRSPPRSASRRSRPTVGPRPSSSPSRTAPCTASSAMAGTARAVGTDGAAVDGDEGDVEAAMFPIDPDGEAA